MLQRMAEIMEYHELLDKAAATEARRQPAARAQAQAQALSPRLASRRRGWRRAAVCCRAVCACAHAAPPHPVRPPPRFQDPELRLVYVVCFAVGAYPSAERTYKPFNPILGETFELVQGDTRYLAEQVSHHPPVGAGHARGRGWEYEITSSPRTKFLGNSIDVFPVGRTRITIGDEVYALHPPQSRVHNILVGRTWVDHFGELTGAGRVGRTRGSRFGLG